MGFAPMCGVYVRVEDVCLCAIVGGDDHAGVCASMLLWGGMFM